MKKVWNVIRLFARIAFTPVLIWVVTGILIRVYHHLEFSDFAFLTLLSVIGSFFLVKDDWETAFSWLLRKWFKDDVHNN